MDVKFEGQNVVRHLDLTTHNHMSFPGNSPTWPYLDSMDAMCGDSKCKKALKCVLTPYSPSNCCDGQTPHHIVPKSQFKEQGEAGAAIISSYDSDKAPCICVDGESHSVGKHGEVHALTNVKTRATVGVESGRQIPESKRWTASKAEQVGAESVEEATGCPEECTKAQLRQGHKKMGVMANDKIRPTTAGGKPAPHNGFAS